MNRLRTRLGRRAFLKSGVTAGVVAATAASAQRDNDKPINASGDLPVKEFGRTGHRLPILGCGGSAMAAQWISAYGAPLLSEDERVAMIRHGYDSGIRYFDTARVYGESERIMGKALNGIRDEVYLCSKVAAVKPDDVKKSVEKSLSELDTDYVDCMQIHSPVMEQAGYDGAMGVLEVLESYREQGAVRFIGLTTHVAFETVHKLLATGSFDQVLLARGYFRKGMIQMLSNENIEWRERCMAEAAKHNTAIVIMKVLGANIMSHNAKNIVPGFDESNQDKLTAAAIRWAVQDERIHMLNIGVSVPADIDKNLHVLKGDLTLTDSDRALLADFSGKAYEHPMIKQMNTV